MADEPNRETFIRIPNQLIWDKLEVIDDGVKALVIYQQTHDEVHKGLLKRVRAAELKVNTVMAAASTLLGAAALALIKGVFN